MTNTEERRCARSFFQERVGKTLLFSRLPVMRSSSEYYRKKFVNTCPPDAEGRQDLLQKYCPGTSWEKLSQDPRMLGMTPAYLRELARRVTRGEDPEAALGSLAQQKQIAS